MISGIECVSKQAGVWALSAFVPEPVLALDESGRHMWFVVALLQPVLLSEHEPLSFGIPVYM